MPGKPHNTLKRTYRLPARANRSPRRRPRRSRFGLAGCSIALSSILVLTALPAFALGPPRVPRFVQDFFSHPTPGYLGVYVRDVPAGAAPGNVGSQPQEKSQVEVVAVDHDAPAGKAGIRVHDRILKLNGQPVENSAQLKSILLGEAPGSTVKLLLEREGHPVKLSVKLANRVLLEQRAWAHHYSVPDPADEERAKQEETFAHRVSSSSAAFPTLIPNPLYVGVDLSPVRAQLADFFGVTGGTGLLVESVASDSPASRAGLKAGDVILRVDSDAMDTRSDWMKAIRENQGKTVKVSIMRHKQERTLTMAAGSSGSNK